MQRNASGSVQLPQPVGRQNLLVTGCTPSCIFSRARGVALGGRQRLLGGPRFSPPAHAVVQVLGEDFQNILAPLPHSSHTAPLGSEIAGTSAHLSEALWQRPLGWGLPTSQQITLNLGSAPWGVDFK